MVMSVDVVIPVLNEQDTLEKNILIILDYINNNINDEYQCRIVIADNGSTDDTPQISRQLEESNPGVIYYQKVAMRGVGLALKTAWGNSQSDMVGYMDLDLATDLRHLPEALNALAKEGYDVVYGTRLHKDSRVYGRSLKRGVISRVFNNILRKYLGVKFSDGMCGFKFLKTEKLHEILKNGAESNGWFFCTELLVVAEWADLKLYELPVKWTDSPDSKVKVGSLSLEYIKAMRNLKTKKK